MNLNDKTRARFTLSQLPAAPVFEKGGVQQPVFGKTFQVIEPQPSPLGVNVDRRAKRFGFDLAHGFHANDVRVKVPEFKPTKVKTTLGLEGEAKRAFKPLVQSPAKARTIDR